MGVAVTSAGPWPAFGPAQAARQAAIKKNLAACRCILDVLGRKDTVKIGPLEIIFILFVVGNGLVALLPILSRNRRKPVRKMV